MDDPTDIANEGLYALVVDDDADMRGLICSIMLDYGHVPVAASSAEEALAALPHYTFQIAYIDHNLPGMEGIVFGEWLRKNNVHMEVALVTGSQDPELEEVARSRNIRFIEKPFEVRELLELPTAYVEKANERLEESEASEFFDPPIAAFVEDLSAHYDLPSVPDRIATRLAQKIRDALSNMHSVNRYSERERIAALSGLLAARVLGVRLPKGRGGESLYEEYDAIMRSRGLRTEFDGP